MALLLKGAGECNNAWKGLEKRRGGGFHSFPASCWGSTQEGVVHVLRDLSISVHPVPSPSHQGAVADSSNWACNGSRL